MRSDNGSWHPMEQSEAATLVGVSVNTWSLWETGRRGMHEQYLMRWLHMSEPHRKWDPPTKGWGAPGHPLDHVIWRRVPEPQGAFEMDVATPVSDTSAPADPPRDLLLPDCSELEAPFMAQRDYAAMAMRDLAPGGPQLQAVSCPLPHSHMQVGARCACGFVAVPFPEDVGAVDGGNWTTLYEPGTEPEKEAGTE